MFIDILDGGTYTLTIGHAVKGPYEVLGEVQHTLIIQQKNLVKWITVYRPAIMPQEPSVSVSASAETLKSRN